ncbi:MAG TPA: hypothetical protein PLL78_01655 [Fimbriimonadaceae bacterium]|nr:hypothetical protein [Fimbriimonadaceae bacterium]HRJ95362.1 hypothetical protein [Fimbriimonadaceae bacterium]
MLNGRVAKESFMSSPLKMGVYLLVGVVALLIIAKLIASLLSWILPLAVVVAIALVVYGLVSRKSLGGSGRSLP